MPMEGWQAAFTQKSSRRRRRAKINKLVKRGTIIVVVSGVILFAMWLIDNFSRVAEATS